MMTQAMTAIAIRQITAMRTAQLPRPIIGVSTQQEEAEGVRRFLDELDGRCSCRHLQRLQVN